MFLDKHMQIILAKKHGFQCGHCTLGFIMNCYALLNIHPNTNDETIKERLQSNICLCTSYEGIKEEVLAAIKSKKRQSTPLTCKPSKPKHLLKSYTDSGGLKRMP